MGDTFEARVRITKVDTDLGLLFGYVIVCKLAKSTGMVEYEDLQGDVVEEHEMLAAVTDFAASQRVAREMHEGGAQGVVLHSMPMTEEVAKAFHMKWEPCDGEGEMWGPGWIVAIKPDAALLAKFKDGSLPELSLGGGAERVKVAA